MLGNIAKRFEWPLVRKALDKCSPFTIYTCVSHCYGFTVVSTDRQAQREDQGDLGVAGA